MEALKCEVCGGELAWDAQNDLFLCEYCGTKFPKATVAPAAAYERYASPMESAEALELLIRSGRKMLELGVYDKAREFFQEATDKYPGDYRGWWHLFLCDTKSMTDIRPDKEIFYKTKELEYAFRTAPKDVLPELFGQYRAFAGQCMKKACDIEMVELVSECRKIDADLTAQETVLADALKKLRLFKRGRNILLAGGGIFFLGVAFFPLGPLILLGVLLLAVAFVLFVIGLIEMVGLARNGYMNSWIVDMQKKERDRLLQLKRAKQEYLEKLQAYIQSLPITMERLTITDILNQKRYVA